MDVSTTSKFTIPAATAALSASRPAHMDMDQRYILNPNLSPADLLECNSLRNNRDLAAVTAAGFIGVIGYLGVKGVQIFGDISGGWSQVWHGDKTGMVLVGTGVTVTGFLSRGLLESTSHFDDEFYNKCMVRNPSFSLRAAAISDSKYDFTAVKLWLATAAVFTGHQVAKGAAGELSAGAVATAGVASVFAPFFVSLRSFVTLHEPRPNVL